MPIIQYPAPTQIVSFNNVAQPVSVSGIPTVAIQSNAVVAKTIKSAANTNATQTLHTLSNSSNHLVIHSLTIAQHITSGNQGDRLGLMVGYATTSAGYVQSDTNPTTSTTFASCYEDKGTVTYNFGETGLKLPAGNNIYFFYDYYNNSSANFAITVVYREVTP